MTINELLPHIEGELLSPGADQQRPVSCGYTCDLLSWVMAHGKKDMAWITVQTHLNVIAVASLAEMSCVILPDNVRMETVPLMKARQEGIAVITSGLSAYELCGRMTQLGIRA